MTRLSNEQCQRKRARLWQRSWGASLLRRLPRTASTLKRPSTTSCGCFERSANNNNKAAGFKIGAVPDSGRVVSAIAMGATIPGHSVRIDHGHTGRNASSCDGRLTFFFYSPFFVFMFDSFENSGRLCKWVIDIFSLMTFAAWRPAFPPSFVSTIAIPVPVSW